MLKFISASRIQLRDTGEAPSSAEIVYVLRPDRTPPEPIATAMRRTTHCAPRLLVASVDRFIRGKKMTVVNIHGRPEQDHQADTPRSTWFIGRPRPASLNFWLTGIAFL